jgi:CHAT domain-containing protein/predicted negative regulator of RcsB-dependent stress response
MASIRFPVVLGALLASSVLSFLPVAAVAATCDPLLTSEPALFEKSFDLRGRERVSHPLVVPAKSSVIVLAQERGLDVTLEIARNTRVLARADNAVRRTGIQRLTFVSAADTETYAVNLVGKEEADVEGAVDVRVVAVPKDACGDVQRTLAAADVSFAAGQSVTQGTVSPTPVADAPSAYAAAARSYIAAALSLESSGPSLLLAQAQHATAAAVHQKREWSRAEEWARKAAGSYAAVAEPYGRARAQALQAEAMMEIAWSPSPNMDVARTLDEARALLTAIAAFHAPRGERFDQALALNNIGLTYYQEGRHDEAIRAFARVLPLYEALGSRVRQAQVLQNIALAESSLGRLSDSIGRYARVLELINPKDQPRPYAIILANSAQANRTFGNVDPALRQFGEAFELFRALQEETWQAQCLHGIGSVYDAMGDRELALDFYRQALAIRRAGNDGRGRASSLSAIANILRDQGKAAEALTLHQEAQALVSNAPAAARLRVQVAMDLQALGKRQESLQQLEPVLTRERATEDVQGAHALLVRGVLESAAGNFRQAEADLRSALATFRNFEAPADELAAWVALARVKRQAGQPDQAFAALDQALVLAEEVRVQSANPELRATVMQPLRPVFDLRLELLAERYAVAGERGTSKLAMQALMTAEQARMRALEDFRSLDVTASEIAPEKLQKRHALYRELASRRFQLEAQLNRSAAQDLRVTSLRAEISGLRQQLDRINAEIGLARTRGTPTDSTAERAPIDLRRVPSDTAIIEYWLGDERALAWVVTRDGVVMKDLGPTIRITDAARAFHAALRGFGVVPLSERLKQGEALHRLVVQPLGAALNGRRTLIFAPDGALHYVPFAALRSEGKFLVDTHDVAITSSIRMLLDRQSGKHVAYAKQMLVVDDPVYEADDARIVTVADINARERKSETSSVWRFRGPADGVPLRRLPGSGREADAIAALLPKDSIVRLQGFNATRERFLRADLGQYRFIHVASHAVTDSEIPQLSALILSTVDRQGRKIDGRVLAADLLGTELSAEAVVLSACDTSMGKNISGEGLVGLRYAILARGARSVVSSFWPVADQAAEQLMTRFYSSLLRGKVSLVAASGDAMRGMRSGVFADPAMWAAFAVTIGGIDNGEQR